MSKVEAVRGIVRAKPVAAVVVTNLLSLFSVLYLYSRRNGGVWTVSKRLLFKLVFSFVKAVPTTGNLVAKENEKVRASIQKSVIGDLDKEERHLALPEKGWTKDKVTATLQRWKEHDEKLWTGGQVSGCVYHGGEELSSLLREAQGMFLLSNPLHPDVFPTVRKMEAEIVRMCLTMFRGNDASCGTVTSGGTESIIMAVRAAKLYAGKTRGVVEGEVVAPVTAHAAFDKACEYFGLTLVHVDVDPITRRVDPRAMARAITRNTILLVGSAPSYANGCVDPIPELAALAKKKKILLHVDCCLGSLLVASARILGYDLPAFDFSVDGVTSISCDTHKYGYAPKGTSVIMYSNSDLRSCQYFVAPEWTGGIYASPTIAGSRPGAVSAATWAAMMHIGLDGYLDAARKILTAAEEIEAAIHSLDGLCVIGRRDLSVISFGPDRNSKGKPVSIYHIADTMKERGWNLNILQNPPSAHICVTYCNAGQASKFAKDLEASVGVVRAAPAGTFKDGSAALYGMAESIPDKGMIGDFSKFFIDALFQA